MMAPVRSDLPSGTVTFLFTDIEGSTRLLHQMGAADYAEVLMRHRRLLRAAFTRRGGVEVGTEGDSFFVVFPTASGAVAAAEDAQAALDTDELIRVRMGLHTGTASLIEGDYVGMEVHKAARIAAAGHGGQVLISRDTRLLVQRDVVDLGEHRLKDFEQPVWIFQLGSRRFPPLKTLSNTNLPRPANAFVGRELEVGELLSLLRGPSRLVTLTGPGGAGKTRLALEAAAELVPEFRSGVFWVDLAPLRDAALVVDTIAHALGAREELSIHIRERELLLVLDNFEQVIAAAPALADLVETCPNTTVLVTSRELLRVRGEVEYRVQPLADPEAVELFCLRAGGKPDETVDQLCRSLDNLPLAIELAAARARVLSPQQILKRLSDRLDLLVGARDADPRQQTLRSTIAWSHDLLSPEEQQLFARLSIFRGGGTLEAIEHVAAADIDTLHSLVDKSLLRRSGERFWMLETIRDFAAERLLGEGENAWRDRHLDYFMALSERAFAERFNSEDQWAPILEAEHDNIRTALDWARTHHLGAEVQLAGAVAPYWLLRTQRGEAADRLTGALARYQTRDRIRARALTHRGELDDSIAELEEALSIWREVGDRQGEAAALELIGWAHDAHGNYEAAKQAHRKSLALRREAGAPEIEGALSRAGLCHLLVASGEVELAETMARDLLTVGRESNSSQVQQLALHFLADCPLVVGDYSEARRRYLLALDFARKAGLPRRCTDETLGVAMAYAGEGDFARAVRLAAAARAEQGRISKANDQWWISMQERLIGGARQRLSVQDLGEAEQAGTEMPFEAVLDELLGVGAAP